MDLKRLEAVSLELPASGFTVTYSDNGLFILFIENEVYVWDQYSAPRLNNQDMRMLFFSPMSPVQIGRNLYFQSREGKEQNVSLMCFDLDKLSLSTALQYGEH